MQNFDHFWALGLAFSQGILISCLEIAVLVLATTSISVAYHSSSFILIYFIIFILSQLFQAISSADAVRNLH